MEDVTVIMLQLLIELYEFRYTRPLKLGPFSFSRKGFWTDLKSYPRPFDADRIKFRQKAYFMAPLAIYFRTNDLIVIFAG